MHENINENSKKTEKELEYFEEKIFAIIIKLQKNEYKDDKENIKWDDILTDAEKIEGEIDNIIVDLSDIQVTNEEIAKLSLYTNNILNKIIDKDEKGLMNELTMLYNQIPLYMKEFEKDERNLIMKKELKSLVLENYNNLLQNNLSEINTQLENIENKYNEMLGNNSYLEENSYNINKIYVLIQEYKTSILNSNIEIVKIKFINLIEEIK